MLVRNSLWEGRISTAAMISLQIKVAFFGAQAERISYEALSAECVRVALWALSNHMESLPLAQASVSTPRLLDQSRTFWGPFKTAQRVESKQELLLEPDIDRELLDVLEKQGDVLSLAGGSWLPTPLRLVPLTANHYLLVGGIPTHFLPASIQQLVVFHGTFRQLDNKAISTLEEGVGSFLDWRFQSLDSWLGSSPATLEDLVRHFELQELHPVISQSDSSLEAYVADDNQPQYLRWYPIKSVSDGRYLLRTSTPWGMKQYSIGAIHNYRLTQQSGELRKTDIRRLCYALDKRAYQPTWASWNAQHRELLLRSELPGREVKFLSSIGTMQENKEGYYPRRWIIPPQFVNSVEEMLTNLGIQIRYM